MGPSVQFAEARRQKMETSPPYCTRMESIDQFVVVFEKLRKTTISFFLSTRPSVCLYVCLSVRIWQLGVHWTDFHGISYFSKICQKYSRTTGTLQGHICTLMMKSRWILHKVRHVSDKCCRDNQNTHFICNVFFFFFSKILPFRKQRKKHSKLYRPQMMMVIIIIIIIIVFFYAFAIIINVMYRAVQCWNYPVTDGVIRGSAEMICQYCTQILSNILLTCSYFVINKFSSNFMSLQKIEYFDLLASCVIVMKPTPQTH